MKKSAALIAFTLIILASAAAADGPAVNPVGKLFGFVIDPESTSFSRSTELYGTSGANCVFVDLFWCHAQISLDDSVPNRLAKDRYNFSVFDKDPLLAMEQTKIVRINLAHKAAEDIRRSDPQRYQKLVQAFVSALVQHCNEKGITHFDYAGDELKSRERMDWKTAYGAMLPHIYLPMKEVSKDNLLLAGSNKIASEEIVQALYDAGIKPHFDVLAVNAGPTNSKYGVDMRSVSAACAVMRRNRDDTKQVFVIQGWGPSGTPGQAEVKALNDYARNGFRNLLTPREGYNPAWLLGAVFSMPKWKSKAAAEFVKDFPPAIPRSSLEINIGRDVASGVLLTGQKYPVKLEFANLGVHNVELLDISLSAEGADGAAIERKSEKKGTVIANEAVTAAFSLSLPEDFAGAEAVLIGEATFSLAGEKYLVDCLTRMPVASRLEVNVLPKQLVLAADGKEATVGMSIINHSSDSYEGTVELDCPEGISVEPRSREVNVASLGLEAFIFNLRASGIAAGKYPVRIVVGNATAEIEVEVAAK